jgi:hypothetical protein
MIEFVTASHNEKILMDNLLLSPILKGRVCHTIPGFTNIPKAYNSLHDYFEAIQTKHQVVIYVHHDVYLNESFEKDLEKALERVPDDWGVLGVAGVKLIDGKKQFLGYVNDRGKVIGSPYKLPAEVDTLDEMLLITRGDLLFDEQFEQDFYGADICMQARQQGRKCYAINAYCEHHSSRPFGGRTDSFYESEKRFREKWKEWLPIVTTCAILNDVQEKRRHMDERGFDPNKDVSAI